MRVLVLGVGLQGKAVIHDLEQSLLVTEIIAVDLDQGAVEEYIRGAGCTKTRALGADASDEDQLSGLLRETSPQLVICMLPPPFGYPVAAMAVENGIHFVSTSYAGRIGELDDLARQKGVVVLPEMGLDPGIDLVLGALAVGQLDEVQGLYSYGAGLPEPACADDNPLKYKITWTFEGVLKSYNRPARLLRDGRELSLKPQDIFHPDNIHMVDIPGLGEMEAYPNGDAIHFIDLFGLDRQLAHMGRYAMRWPGHCRFWRTMSELGFLAEEPLAVDGGTVSPRQFLNTLLSPRLQYEEYQRDLVVLRIHAWGIKDGKNANVIYELVDYRDLETGLFAMNRTVGFTASIAAQMILSGTIREPGVLSPIRNVPPALFIGELEARGIKINHRIE